MDIVAHSYKNKPRTVCSQEGEDDEGITPTNTTTMMSYAVEPKVQASYVRFTFYIFEQRMLHHELCVFLFAEVLSWIKKRIEGSRNKWMIKEIDWGPNHGIFKPSPIPSRRFWTKG